MNFFMPSEIRRYTASSSFLDHEGFRIRLPLYLKVGGDQLAHLEFSWTSRQISSGHSRPPAGEGEIAVGELRTQGDGSSGIAVKIEGGLQFLRAVALEIHALGADQSERLQLSQNSLIKSGMSRSLTENFILRIKPWDHVFHEYGRALRVVWIAAADRFLVRDK